jgi:choline dehydrogenase-like flavoprotein
MTPASDADFIVVGSGAGGAAAAWVLAQAGLRVLILERGSHLPDSLAPLRAPAFRGTDAWRSPRGRTLVPDEYYNPGGKTRWYGAALMRFPAHDFVSQPEQRLLPWPFDREELLESYASAERRLGVRSFPPEPELLVLGAALARRGWRSEALPLALAEQARGHPLIAPRFDGYALARGWKGDAWSAFIEPAIARPNCTLRTDAPVVALLPSRGDPTRVAGVRLRDGSELRAGHVLLAAGALHSPRLLRGYLAHQELLSRLQGSRWIGRYLKRHIVSLVLCFGARTNHDGLRKTLAFSHAAYPHSGVQALGDRLVRERLRVRLAALAAGPLGRVIGERMYAFMVQTEDGSHPANRVLEGPDRVPTLDYDPRRLPQYREHVSCTRALALGLRAAGRVCVTRAVSAASTAHACGTLLAGSDPAASVIGGDACVHGLRNVWVMDGSALPRSGSVNPALTIFAWALRATEGLLRTA